MRTRVHLSLNGHLPQGLPLEVHLEGQEVRGTLRQENPILGELVLPFASRLEGDRLLPLPLTPPYLRVGGRARPGREGTFLELELELVLPPGGKWGERALGRILEALFLRSLEGALSQPSPPWV
ncbi:DUF3809 family protein [Thermus igniterrae]|jgi:hypothetical protein|uniref:DUF3809 family protein n=1 Tax=Thermus igniterrae TaxID=88189 RepID=UPI00035CFDA5|nr:DUF3809 family protein [Thermus igniterrae]